MTKEQFIEMIALEQESLRRFLRGLCSGDGFRADDLAQEALLKAYLSFERFEGRSRFPHGCTGLRSTAGMTIRKAPERKLTGFLSKSGRRGRICLRWTRRSRILI